jgi:hypothetical protein
MQHRRAAGQFYTPRPVVQYIVQQTFDRLFFDCRTGGELRILEPACGEGIFLVEAYRYLRGLSPDDDGLPERILRHGLYGVDRDEQAVRQARRTLAALAGGDALEQARLECDLAKTIRCGDALLGRDLDTGAAPLDWNREFPEIFQAPRGGFDAVIGNPPYVNIRLLTRHHGAAVKDYLRDHYRCAAGAYDLYVLFLELALRLLRPGGICGMIVPNKLATLDYARNCRAMLLREATLLTIADLSGCRVFPQASVYPYVVIWKKEPAPTGHRIAVVQTEEVERLAGDLPVRYVAQHELVAQAGWHLHGSLDVESRVPTRPLGEVADIHSGTTGFEAARIAALLRDGPIDDAEPGFEFVVTGNVDRYAVRTGEVRFMKRRWMHPVLPDDPSELTPAKRRLYGGAKILVAGMSRRLEAAWDPGGLALGVQLYAVVPKIDPYYLLALLNSTLLSHLFRLRFQAKRLAGGYLAVNKSQLAALPIRMAHDQDGQAIQQELAALARELTELGSAVFCGGRIEAAANCATKPQIDRQIDERVYQLYALTDDEIQRVEADCDAQRL